MVLEPARRLDGRVPQSFPGEARRALEQALLEGLVQGPTCVSFSGGRDSSLLLAVACHVARSHGFEDPVPITMRHSSKSSDEEDWQELVVRHLDLGDWIKVEVADTMDVCGPAAMAVLRQAGVLAPPNAYLHIPVFERAQGTVFIGAGGDEVLGTPGDREAHVLYGRARPELRDVVRVARASLPRALRTRRMVRRLPNWQPWMKPAAQAEAAWRFAADASAFRYRWDATAVHWATGRTARLLQESLDAVAVTYGVRAATPLASAGFVTAFAGEIGPAGPVSRRANMRLLSEDLLPAALIERSTKASFDALVWGPAFEKFVETWDPGTLSPEVAALVDVDALLAAWRSGSPPYLTMMLLEKAVLDSVADA